MTITSLNVDKLQQCERQQIEVYSDETDDHGSDLIKRVSHTNVSDAARYKRALGLIT
jgi:hypothetical protein